MAEEPRIRDRAMSDLGISDYRIPPSDVQTASDLIAGSREQVRCGRLTKAGTACGQLKARLLLSCPLHSTPDEQVAAEVERARLAALVDAWSASLAPACHSWPVVDDDRRAVEALPKLADDELLEARHVHTLIGRWQQDRCAVCGALDDDLVLDHDHVTALVRGYLCRSCNGCEPHSDRGDFTKYRDRSPAAMLGVSARYEHPWYGLAQPESWLDRSHYDPSRSPAYKLMGRLGRHLDRKDQP